MLKLKHPFAIGSRLLPELTVGDGKVSLEAIGCVGNRLVWRWHIDTPAGEFSEADLKASPTDTDNAEGTRHAFCSLLNFLGACAESYPDGENATLFPAEVAEWAQVVQDELAVLRCEIEEDHTCIEDEEDS